MSLTNEAVSFSFSSWLQIMARHKEVICPKPIESCMTAPLTVSLQAIILLRQCRDVPHPAAAALPASARLPAGLRLLLPRPHAAPVLQGPGGEQAEAQEPPRSRVGGRQEQLRRQGRAPRGPLGPRGLGPHGVGRQGPLDGSWHI